MEAIIVLMQGPSVSAECNRIGRLLAAAEFAHKLDCSRKQSIKGFDKFGFAFRMVRWKPLDGEPFALNAELVFVLEQEGE